ncbi:hypothetical protein [Salinibaculum rarum]|uniref:hypothetical protein n=1 Tax=Salinibaculum rarum TaxID=3058903 RepID=UPI0026603FB9|nr:hypothetical protein [Salinibaculum sp. KK48]
MVSLSLDRLPLRGMVIGILVLGSGTVTAALTQDPILPALVAAIVLLVLLVVDGRSESEE